MDSGATDLRPIMRINLKLERYSVRSHKEGTTRYQTKPNVYVIPGESTGIYPPCQQQAENPKAEPACVHCEHDNLHGLIFHVEARLTSCTELPSSRIKRPPAAAALAQPLFYFSKL